MELKVLRFSSRLWVVLCIWIQLMIVLKGAKPMTVIAILKSNAKNKIQTKSWMSQPMMPCLFLVNVIAVLERERPRLSNPMVYCNNFKYKDSNLITTAYIKISGSPSPNEIWLNDNAFDPLKYWYNIILNPLRFYKNYNLFREPRQGPYPGTFSSIDVGLFTVSNIWQNSKTTQNKCFIGNIAKQVISC